MRRTNRATGCETVRFSLFSHCVNQTMARSQWLCSFTVVMLIAISAMVAMPKPAQTQMMQIGSASLNGPAFERNDQKDVNTIKESFRAKSPVPFAGRVQADHTKASENR